MGELTIILCSIHMHMQYLHEAFLLGVGEEGGKKAGTQWSACPALPLSACLFFFFLLPVEAETRGFFSIYSHRKASKHKVGKKKKR